MGHKPRRKLLVKIQKHGDYYAFIIAGKNLKLKSSANGSVYRICDIVEKLPETIDCNGLHWPVTLILKIYCRVPQQQLKRQREAIRYAQLLKGRYVLSDD